MVKAAVDLTHDMGSDGQLVALPKKVLSDEDILCV
jgi:hypothetical protein